MDIKKKFLEENLSINNNSSYNHQLNLLLKNKIEGKNSKILKSLKENEKSLSFNIGKLTTTLNQNIGLVDLIKTV